MIFLVQINGFIVWFGLKLKENFVLYIEWKTNIIQLISSVRRMA